MGDVRKKSEGGGGVEKSSSTTKFGKLPVAEQASFSKFFLVLLMHMCKRVLIVETTRLAWFYICSITLISLFTDLFPFPRSYFSNKEHVWNQYFVKLGLAWTLLALGPFIYLTSFVLSLGRVKHVYRHLGRLVITIICWFVITSVTTFLEGYRGTCSLEDPQFNTRETCKQNGGTWTKWLDISGHSFLLVLCILTTAEEAVVFRDWSKISELIRKQDDKLTSKLTSSEIDTLKLLYEQYTPYVRCILVLMSALQVLWNIMLFATALYFHNMPDKFCGVILGVVCWTLSYHVLYKMDNSLPLPLDISKSPFKHLKQT